MIGHLHDCVVILIILPFTELMMPQYHVTIYCSIRFDLSIFKCSLVLGPHPAFRHLQFCSCPGNKATSSVSTVIVVCFMVYLDVHYTSYRLSPRLCEQCCSDLLI